MPDGEIGGIGATKLLTLLNYRKEEQNTIDLELEFSSISFSASLLEQYPAFDIYFAILIFIQSNF